MHDYRDFVVENHYAIFIQIPGPYVARAQEQVVHLQL